MQSRQCENRPVPGRADRRVPTPPGTWSSPLSATDVATMQLTYCGVAVSDGGETVWWAEGPTDADGGMTVRRRTGAGPIEQMLPAHLNARTRVHAYGGMSWTLAAGTVIVSNLVDQRLYQVDGVHALALTPETGATDRYAEPTALTGRDWAVCVRERIRYGRTTHALVAVPLDGSGLVVELWTGSDFVAAPAVSPDGRRIAFLTWDHPQMPWDGSVLRVASLAEGRPAISEVADVLGSATESVLTPSWIDNDTLCAVTDRSGWWNLVTVPAAGGPPKPVWPIDRECGVPPWQLGFGTYRHLPDDRFAVVADGALHVVDRQGTATTTGPPATWWLPWLASDGNVVCGVGAAEDRRPAIIRVDTSTGAWEQVGGPDQPHPAWVPRPTELRTASTAPRQVPAVFYPPTSPNQRIPDSQVPPCVMFLHGGPTATSPRYYRDEIAFFTSRGLAVATVDYAGSSGHGRVYRDALRGQWGLADVEDCLAVARSLLRGGQVSHIVVRGVSAGGFTALTALTRPDTPFTAGISYAGVVDLAATTEEFESRYLEGLIGPLPQSRALYTARSPLSHVQAIDRPVLLLHGLNDTVVPVTQTQAFARGLAANHTPHAVVTFPDEAHIFSAPDAIAAALNAELSFLGQVLGFAPHGGTPLAIDHLPTQRPGGTQ